MSGFCGNYERKKVSFGFIHSHWTGAIGHGPVTATAFVLRFGLAGLGMIILIGLFVLGRGGGVSFLPPR